MSLGRLVAAFVWQHKGAYASAALLLSGVAVLSVWIPRHVGQMVDAMVAGGLTGRALPLELGLLLGAGLAIYGLRVTWRQLLFGASFRLGQRLRVQLFDQLCRQAPSYFQSQRGGDLMALATNDVDAVEQAAGEALLAAFDGSLTLLLVLAMMTVGIDWRLAAVALLPFPLMGWAFYLISSRIHACWAESLDHFGQMSRQAQQGLTHVRTVRAMGLAAAEQQAFDHWASAAGDASFRAQRWEAAYEPAVGIALTLAAALILGMGGYLIAQGELSVGQLTAFSLLLGQLLWPMFAAGWVLSLIERGRAAWARLAPALKAEATLVDEGELGPVTQARLSLDRVSFGYDQQPLLQQISFELQPGKVLAIVGPTGAGKTTLLRLLLRQWPLTSGTILLDGQPLSRWRRSALADGIAWVPQEPFLFSASVADNIALARPDASPAAIAQAAQLAALDDDIARLPEGYATVVGEKGVSLSGGQRQRVAIARALLSEAPLLLLDDALSAVDTGTESRILSQLRELRRQRPACALIIVSHRLSAAMEADEVLVLHHGKVVERGNHSQLLAADGWYASQWRYQQLEASLND